MSSSSTSWAAGVAAQQQAHLLPVVGCKRERRAVLHELERRLRNQAANAEARHQRQQDQKGCERSSPMA